MLALGAVGLQSFAQFFADRDRTRLAALGVDELQHRIVFADAAPREARDLAGAQPGLEAERHHGPLAIALEHGLQRAIVRF